MNDIELTIEPSYKCMLGCKICSSIGIDENIILNNEELEAILLKIGNKVKVIRLSGGEPLLIPIKKLISYIELINEYCNELETFEILTSGVIRNLYMSNRFLVVCKVEAMFHRTNAKNKRVCITLYGEHLFHEEITNIKGSYELTLGVINTLRSNNIDVYVETPIISYGSMGIIDICRLNNLQLKVLKLLKHGRAKNLPVFSKRKQQYVVKLMKEKYNDIIISNSLLDNNICKCDRKNKITILPDGTFVHCVGTKQLRIQDNILDIKGKICEMI